MQASLLEILREIPDHRRKEGRRFELSTVLLYAILAMVPGAKPSDQRTQCFHADSRRFGEFRQIISGLL